MPVPCVNALRRDYPDYVEYSNQRIPAQGVMLNLDEEFLTGCDCTDGCRVIIYHMTQAPVVSAEAFLFPIRVYSVETSMIEWKL